VTGLEFAKGEARYILRSLRRFFCRHEVDIAQIVRDKAGTVGARCLKCGATLTADCGLALPAKLVQRPWMSIDDRVDEAIASMKESDHG
jgi:hypothetical protein